MEGIRRRAKYMIWDLSSGVQVLMHLGMSGRFVLDGTLAPHDHVVFQIGDHQVRYNDPRRFGFMDLIWPDQPSKFLTHLGPEPLGNEFNGAYLQDQLRGRATPIKTRLMDQKVVVGWATFIAVRRCFAPKFIPPV